MGVIARWECPKHGYVGAGREGQRCGRIECLRELVKVEYVPRTEVDARVVWVLNEALGALVRHDDLEGAIALIEHGLRQAGVDPSRSPAPRGESEGHRRRDVPRLPVIEENHRLRGALRRAYAVLDAEHGHTAETLADRERWTAT
jgi:hypothetical protein